MVPAGTAMGRTVTLFLCGDVMTGRGIDQILPYPVRPHLFEPVVRSARDYVALAEDASGPVPQPASFAYPWGEALDELAARRPDARIVNLETAVTTTEDPWPGKGIHYRMHPDNLPCLLAAGPDCCVLANNHVLDWGRRGLEETLATLARAGIRTAGAGRDRAAAGAPAVLDLADAGRVLVFGLAAESSGAPASWEAREGLAGVAWLRSLGVDGAERVAQRVERFRRRGDLVVVSIHWGGNWGYDVPEEQRAFARALVEQGAADVVHGHSSHHAKGIEVHRDRLILYGCGDFLNDYEGIEGHERFRPELGLMYFPRLESASGRLVELTLVPTRLRRLRVERAPAEAARWLADVLDREGRPFGTGVEMRSDGTLALRWAAAASGTRRVAAPPFPPRDQSAV